MLKMYKCCLNEKGDGLVSHHLKVIASRVCAITTPKALILIGSYGRGEGVIQKSVSGALKPTNDYDIVLVTDVRPGITTRRALKTLRKEIAEELQIWHIDLILMTTAELHSKQIHMLRYDMKYGSHVFYGDASIIDSIPYNLSDQIPVSEILNLLINRMVTLLEGHPDLQLLPTPAARSRQLAKVMYALTDSVLIKNDMYCTAYGQKQKNLSRLDPKGSPLIDFLIRYQEWTARSWRLELSEDESSSENLLDIWQSLAQFLHRDIAFWTEKLPCFSQESSTEQSILNCWRGRTRDRSILKRILCFTLQKQPKERVEQNIFSLLAKFTKEKQNSTYLSSLSKESVDLVKSWYAAI